jgi:hypothetical protein
VFLSKDGTRVVGAQNILPKAILAAGSPGQPQQQQQQSLIRLTSGTATQNAPGTPQKLQIISGPDGIYQVRGLLANQQLIQLPGGKIQVINTPVNSQANTPTTPGILKTTSVGTPLTSKSALTAGARVTTQPPAATQTVTLAPQQVQTVQTVQTSQPVQIVTPNSTTTSTPTVKVFSQFNVFPLKFSHILAE